MFWAFDILGFSFFQFLEFLVLSINLNLIEEWVQSACIIYDLDTVYTIEIKRLEVRCTIAMY